VQTPVIALDNWLSSQKLDMVSASADDTDTLDKVVAEDMGCTVPLDEPLDEPLLLLDDVDGELDPVDVGEGVDETAGLDEDVISVAPSYA